MSREWSDGKVVSTYEQAVRNQAFEEAARVADYFSAWDKTDVPVGEKTAAAIRALKDEKCVTQGE